MMFGNFLFNQQTSIHQIIVFHYLKQKIVVEIESKNPKANNSMPKYSKRVIENLIA